MKEVLLNIGSIVEVEHRGQQQAYMITGKRIINFRTMRAWDYYSVPYPEGHRKDKEGNDDNGFFFNHCEIDKIIHRCNITLKEEGD